MLSQSLRQVCKNQGAVVKWFPFCKSLSKGRKMHLDTKRNWWYHQWYWWKAKKKISWLNKIILLCAVIDRNMTRASMVHVLLWINQFGTAWNGCKRDFTAADAQVLNLYSQNTPLRAEVFSDNLNLRVIFSKIPASIQGIFLQLRTCPLLSLSLLWL